jgi:hypothetical protein
VLRTHHWLLAKKQPCPMATLNSEKLFRELKVRLTGANRDVRQSLIATHI